MSVKSKAALVVLAVLGWALVSLALLFVVADDTAVPVDCPTEDSCVVDYHDGAWHVTRVVP